MRLTSSMMSNTTLMHIQRNMRKLDEVQRQVETSKMISRPSDDPILASRALIFRTSVAENAQFQRNVGNAMGQMNVADASLNNINSRILRQIRDELVKGATDTNTLSQKRGIVDAIQSLFATLTESINQQYAGEFLFSGLRTDEPPVFTQPNQRSFVITQHFSLQHITREQSFQRLPSTAVPPGPIDLTIRDVHVLKLAYNQIDYPAWTAPGTPGPPPVPPAPQSANAFLHIPGFNVVMICQTHPAAYNPGAVTAPTPAPSDGRPVLHFIPQTGELIMHQDTARTFPREGVSVTYQKTGFSVGDINPAVYFTAREIIDTTSPAPSPGANLVYRVTQYFNTRDATAATGGPPPTHFTFTLAYTSYANAGGHVGLRPQLPGGGGIPADWTHVPGTNQVIIPASYFLPGRNVGMSFTVQNPVAPAVPVNPADGPTPTSTHIKHDRRVQGVQLVRATTPAGAPIPLDQAERNRSFDMHNQDRIMEFASNTFLPINTLAKNVLTDKMFADFRRFFEFTNSLHVSIREDLAAHFEAHYSHLDAAERGAAVENAVTRQLILEEGNLSAALFAQFDNMLRLLDAHFVQTTREETQLGARMVRLELLQSRLESDYVTYNRLVSQNEDTHMEDATRRWASAQVVFMASLQANSGIIQMSLANFIR